MAVINNPGVTSTLKDERNFPDFNRAFYSIFHGYGPEEPMLLRFYFDYFMARQFVVQSFSFLFFPLFYQFFIFIIFPRIVMNVYSAKHLHPNFYHPLFCPIKRIRVLLIISKAINLSAARGHSRYNTSGWFSPLLFAPFVGVNSVMRACWVNSI